MVRDARGMLCCYVSFMTILIFAEVRLSILTLRIKMWKIVFIRVYSRRKTKWIKIAAVVLGIIFYDNLSDGVTTTMKHYNPTNATDPWTARWDQIQSSLECCGFDSELDWSEPLTGIVLLWLINYDSYI